MNGAFPAAAGRVRSTRPPRRSRLAGWKRLSTGAKFAIIVASLCVLATAALVFVHATTVDPRDARAVVERELSLNTLAPGERATASVSVFRRKALDYFRATRGLLVLTNKRAIVLTVRPRDLLSPPDAPPTFDEVDYPLDTAVRISAGRTFYLVVHDVVVHSPDGTTRMDVPSSAWPDARSLVGSFTASRQAVMADERRRASLEKEAAAQEKQAMAAWRAAQYYVVERGDALGAIATQWNTTPDKLRQLNSLPGLTIRVGQRLLVRPAS